MMATKTCPSPPSGPVEWGGVGSRGWCAGALLLFSFLFPGFWPWLTEIKCLFLYFILHKDLLNRSSVHQDYFFSHDGCSSCDIFFFFFRL